MSEFTITIDGDVDPVKLREALDIAIEAVRGALAQAGVSFSIGGSISEANGEAEEMWPEKTEEEGLSPDAEVDLAAEPEAPTA